MANRKWTQTQARRLKELGINPEDIQNEFSSKEERNKIFQKMEKKQVKIQRNRLENFLTRIKKTRIQRLREKLEKVLFDQGFTSVQTPIITTKQALKKMTIDEDHPLSRQVYWISDNQCLRPMLATNLYSLMQDFGRVCQKPVRFFEMGSCFRKESSGASHSNEFTMLNLVEMGLPEQERQKRLAFLAEMIIQTAGINEYCFEQEESEVYGSTLDVLAGSEKIEIASGAMGPHPLDAAWNITDTWVGMGFGLERLLMVSQDDHSIGKWSKNLAYIDGICLNI